MMERECGLTEIMEMSMDVPVQRQVVDSQYVYHKPIGPVDGATEIEFLIPNDSDMVIDLANTELVTTFRVKKGNGNLAVSDKVSVINAIGATLFNYIDCWLNNTLVTERTPNQAFRAIVEILTSHGQDAANSWLQSSLFFKDEAEQMDNTNPAPTAANAEVNGGLKQRFQYTKESKRVVVRSRIHSDVFNQARPLINMVPLRLKFKLNDDKYCLLSDKDNVPYKIVIEDMAMRVRYEKLSDDIYREVVNRPVSYPIARVKVKEDVIPIGVNSYNLPNFVTGELPQKIIIGIVTNKAVNGDYTKNPFNFQNFNVTQLSLNVNNSVHGGTPLDFDFANDQFESGYWSLFEASGKKYRDDGMLIRRDDYKSGYALYAFDISPTPCNIGEYRDPERRGNISIAIKFAAAPTETLVLCAYLQFNGRIDINEAKQVTLNYKS